MLEGLVTEQGTGVAVQVDLIATELSPLGVDRDAPWLDIAAASTRIAASTWSTRHGTFVLPDLAPGSYAVRTHVGGRDVRIDAVKLGAHGVRQRLRIERDPGVHVLHGRAVHADGTPCEGWLLAGTPKREREHGPASSGLACTELEPGGTFTLTGLEAGATPLVLVEPGRRRLEAAVVRLPHLGPVEIVVPAKAPPQVVRVVANKDGTPLAGAKVYGRAVVGGYVRELAVARTDADGRAALVLSHTLTSLSVHAPGYAPAQWTRQDAAPPKLRLERMGALAGIVRDAVHGMPVPGAIVHMCAAAQAGLGNTQQTRTDHAGAFVFEDVPPGEVMVFVLGAGYASERLMQARHDGYNPFLHAVAPEKTARIELPVEQAGQIAGRLRSAQGHAIRGVPVRPHVERYTRPPSRMERWFATLAESGITDPGGHFVLPTVPPHARWIVRAPLPAGASARSRCAHVDPGEAVTLDLISRSARRSAPVRRGDFDGRLPGAEIRMPAPQGDRIDRTERDANAPAAGAHVLEGRVVDERGQPAPGVLIDVRSSRTSDRQRTDRDGRFRVTTLANERLDVLVDAGPAFLDPASRNGRIRTHVLEAGPLTIRLERIAPLRIRVVDDRGEAVVGVPVSVVLPGLRRMDRATAIEARTVYTDINGEVVEHGEFRDAAGELVVNPRRLGITPPPGYGSREKFFVVRRDVREVVPVDAWEPPSLEVVLPESYEIRGRVIWREGVNPRNFVAVCRRLGTKTLLFQDIDGASRFEFERLEDGAYDVWVQEGRDADPKDTKARGPIQRHYVDGGEVLVYSPLR